MALCITQNLLSRCPILSKLGGITEILLANSNDITAYTYSVAAATAGQVTAMTFSAGNGFRRFTPTVNTTKLVSELKTNKSKKAGVRPYKLTGEFHEWSIPASIFWDELNNCCHPLTMVIRTVSGTSLIYNNTTAVPSVYHNPATVYLTGNNFEIGEDPENPDHVWKYMFEISGASQKLPNEFAITTPIILP